MNQTPRHHGRFVSPQGLITIALALVIAFLFADAELYSRDYVRLSWLGVQALSFPFGWLAYWVAQLITDTIPAGHDSLKILVVLVLCFAGTVLNIHLFVSVIFWYFRKRNEQRPPEEREAEFQKLLAEHHKRNN